MKRTTYFFLSLLLAVGGCSTDLLDIEESNAVVDNTSGTGNAGDTSSDVNSSDSVDSATDSATSVTDDAEDNITGTDFDRTIAIVFGGTQATVTGDEHSIVTVSGNDVTVNNTTDEKIIYELSGSSQDGFFKLYSNKKQAIRLNGVSLANKNGAAINNQSKKRTFVVVSGTNTLKDGASYTETPSGEDEKAAFFSEGQLVFSGDGSLTVTASGKSGITSDDYVRFMDSPAVTVVSSAGHAVRGKDAVIVTGGTIEATSTAAMKKGFASDSLVRFEGGVTTVTVSGGTAYDSDDQEYKAAAGVKADQLFEMVGGKLTVTSSGAGGKGISGDGNGVFKGGTVVVKVTGSNYGSSSSGRWGGGSSSSDNSKSAKGIKFEGNLTVSGGSVTASSSNHEGIEAKGTITVTGGSVYSSSKDDAINAGSHMTISGGFVCAISSGNDGMDANGNCYIKGGVVYAAGASSPEVGIDANTEGGYKLYVSGGTLLAVGGLENGSSLTQACYSASSWNKNTWYALYSGSDTTPVLCFKTPASGGTSLVVSTSGTPALKSGVSVSGGTSYAGGLAVTGGTAGGGSSVKLASYSGGAGMGGGPGGPGGPGGRW